MVDVFVLNCLSVVIEQYKEKVPFRIQETAFYKDLGMSNVLMLQTPPPKKKSVFIGFQFP